jgi:hypothetical protein
MPARNGSPGLLLALLICLLPAAARAARPCTGGDCVAAAMANSPVRHLRFWRSALHRPLRERMGTAAPALVDYIRLDNIQSGRPERPQASAADAAFRQDVQAVIDGLPTQVQKLLQHKLAGVYLADHIGSTGYTDMVQDRTGKPVAGFVVLDPGTLQGRTANSWASWKENTPFQPTADFQLRAVIETPEQDNRRNALQYILLHEIGHVLSIGTTLTPSWHQPAGKLDAYDFTRLSWQLGADGKELLAQDERQFPQRRDIVYYRQPKLPAVAMAPVYESLAASSFVTLYAATNPFDDFAEAFASYVHVVLLHKPFAITIYQHGQLMLSYGPCWGQPRCAAKQAILAQLLEAN